MMARCSDFDVHVAAAVSTVDDDGRVLSPRKVRRSLPPPRGGARRPASRLRSNEGRRLRRNQLWLRRVLRRRAGRSARPLYWATQVRAGRRRTDLRKPATVQRRT